MASGWKPLSVEFSFDPDQLAEAIDRFGEKAIEHFLQGVQQMAEATMTLSKSAYVPVVTGTLRSSGFVTDWMPHPDGKMIDIGYGGAAASYAEVVHFRPRSVGQGKNLYLTKPLQLMARRSEELMGRWMSALLAGRTTTMPNTKGALKPPTKPKSTP